MTLLKLSSECHYSPFFRAERPLGTGCIRESFHRLWLLRSWLLRFRRIHGLRGL